MHSVFDVGVSFIFLCALVGVGLAVRTALEDVRTSPKKGSVRPGWVYFLSPIGGAVQDPPAPIKVGRTYRDPLVERLPEIETMSPQPLEVLFTIHTEVPEMLEKVVHNELKPYRRHGEWFDRDATLAWIDAFNNAN